jgi:predicted aspartyl protease
MPILTGQALSKTKAPDGKEIHVPSAEGLFKMGPRLQVNIRIAQSIEAELVKRGDKIPVPITGYALIDTGALATGIDESAAKTFGFPVTGTAKISTASQRIADVPIHPVRMEFIGFPIIADAPKAVGVSLSHGIIAIIGRDILQHCIFIYNGQTGLFNLAI